MPHAHSRKKGRISHGDSAGSGNTYTHRDFPFTQPGKEAEAAFNFCADQPDHRARDFKRPDRDGPGRGFTILPHRGWYPTGGQLFSSSTTMLRLILRRAGSAPARLPSASWLVVLGGGRKTPRAGPISTSRRDT